MVPADAIPPPFTPSQLGTTSFDLVATLLVVGAGALYLWGVVRANRLRPRHRWSAWRTTAFLAGLAFVVVALESVVGVYDDVLFWDHMVQHLLLIMVAAPLFALGSPVRLALQATAGPSHRRLAAGLRSGPARFLGNPIVAFLGYAVFIPLSHLTAFYNLTLEDDQVHHLEHLAFLALGYLFWRQVFGVEPGARLTPPLKLGYLFLAVPVDTFTGLSLNSATREIFPAYLNTEHLRSWGPSPVTDLHLGGVVMWVGGDTLMFLAMIPVAIQWLRSEERRTRRVDRQMAEAGPAEVTLAPWMAEGAATGPAGDPRPPSSRA